jgi:hypothetical protein
MGRRSQRGRGQGIRDRVRIPEVDRTNLAVGVAGLLLIVVIALPRVYPAAQRGPDCSDLAAPLGGNQRSSLAFSQGDQVSMDLKLDLDSTTITTGEALRVTVTLVNEDIGPAILFLPDQPPPLQRDEITPGVSFEITRVVDGQAIADGVTVRATQPTTFSSENLHLLGSRARCNVEYDISPTRLQQLGLGAGEYRIRAVYRNNSAGIPQHAPDATATPAYQDQGVWTGVVTSGETRFSIVQPGTAPTG